MDMYKEYYRKEYYPVHEYAITFTAIYLSTAPYNDWIEETVYVFDTDEESAIDVLRKEYSPFFMSIAILNVERIKN